MRTMSITNGLELTSREVFQALSARIISLVPVFSATWTSDCLSGRVLERAASTVEIKARTGEDGAVMMVGASSVEGLVIRGGVALRRPEDLRLRDSSSLAGTLVLGEKRVRLERQHRRGVNKHG
jgi:hypothetical protein